MKMKQKGLMLIVLLIVLTFTSTVFAAPKSALAGTTSLNVQVSQKCGLGNNFLKDEIVYHAKKKEVIYQCKICKRTFKTSIMAHGHVRGIHNKFFTGLHIKKITV